MTGRELVEHVPGDTFLIGGSDDEIDGAERVGSSTLSPLSPMLSNIVLDAHSQPNPGETVRIGTDMYTIVKNGIEVQQIAVH